MPIYDKSSLHGFFMACGTSGNQFKNAPIAGQFLRDIIDATMSGHDHDADPLQFRGAFTGKLIDLGALQPQAQASQHLPHRDGLTNGWCLTPSVPCREIGRVAIEHWVSDTSVRMG